ncbi:serine/threonine protein kinase [Nocardioides anomalus]|uniref:non-specific serine/threonine protein kinase n=1 Tax=Nocardioides anomalus TaxID=2712223 RepID=A0A6G6WI52_9ACTN|nr:serine/threonine-protein kinase [Nocardioides anomalus]QIG44740.1 serine/threonine protein kinase [Nocardioides anomalus]
MPRDLIAGRYRVEREIGRGGMGAVWLCRDERLGRPVAVKQVGGLPGESSLHLARALREARHSAALSHPNVVALYDALEEGDHVWLVMEYVASRTLDAMLREDGPLPPARVAAIGADVADGLAAAHALGTVHRDVKPSNILVRDEDGHALIADFGIARTVGQEQLTRSGLVTGTPAYFAPELARGDEPTPASDVWALGVSLHAATEGRAPYDDQVNALAVLNAIAHDPPPEPTRAGPLTGPLRRMLDPDPTTRATMQESAAALRAAATRPAPTPRPAPEPPPAPAPARRRGPVMALVLVLLVALAGLGGWWLTQGEDRPDAPTASPGRGPASSTPEPTRTPSRSPQPTPTPDPTPEPPAGDAASLVSDYYATLPDDTDAGWAMLSAGMQARIGRGTYDGFWATIDDVAVDEVSADGDVVRVTLTYTTDGRTEQETRELTVTDGLISADSGAV